MYKYVKHNENYDLTLDKEDVIKILDKIYR